MKSGNRTAEFPPQRYARIAGILYLVIILAGIFGEALVRGKLIVSGDASATANNILTSQLLWRIGISADLLMHVCDIPVMLILYVLLKPVNKNLALLNLLFNLVQTAVLAANKLNLLMSLFLLGNADYLKAVDSQQLHSLSYLFIKLHDYGFGVGLIFFGFVCMIEGYLIFKSGYFPKPIGIMMQIAGVCYLVNSFSLILAPLFATMLFPVILIPSFVAELSLCLWLIIKGVNLTKWEQRLNANRNVV
ncbi:MAG TPA: DUF4386 domain-containing protein [Chitinophagales bacterium]|nr:DUF4386 domain-containing protein [Chitinophagales bacterium]